MQRFNLNNHPLCNYFLAGYLAKKDDFVNFPAEEFPAILDRYEGVFDSALRTLGVAKEILRRKSEFNFDSGDAANLESGIAVLRTVEALRLEKFESITLVSPLRGKPGADLSCLKNGIKICVEIKTVAKQSTGRKRLFFEEQLYEKLLEEIGKARKQLEVSAAELQCAVKLVVFVVNWFEQSIYLGLSDYHTIVNKLERNNDQESLQGIDGVLFLTQMGQRFLFVNERGKCIDCE